MPRPNSNLTTLSIATLLVSLLGLLATSPRPPSIGRVSIIRASLGSDRRIGALA